MKTKNARKSNKNVKATKGTPGAPKKAVKYPRGNFTVLAAIALNHPKICGLTVRNRITADVEKGLLAENGTRPQPNGKVGRPSTLFILASLKKATKNKAKAKATFTKPARKVTKGDTVVLATVATVTPPPAVEAAPEPVVAEVTPAAPSAEKVIAPVEVAPLP